MLKQPRVSFLLLWLSQLERWCTKEKEKQQMLYKTNEFLQLIQTLLLPSKNNMQKRKGKKKSHREWQQVHGGGLWLHKHNASICLLSCRGHLSRLDEVGANLNESLLCFGL